MDGADRYRNPEHDLPTDFAAQRDHYDQQLPMPRDAEAFIHRLQTTLRQWLATLNGGLPENPKVRLRQQGQNLIHLTPLDVATCNRKSANLQSRVFFNRHYLQLKGVQTDIKCN